MLTIIFFIYLRNQNRFEKFICKKNYRPIDHHEFKNETRKLFKIYTTLHRRKRDKSCSKDPYLHRRKMLRYGIEHA